MARSEEPATGEQVARTGAERRRDEPSAARPEAAEQRSSLLGFVAHEIRNPLSTALWSAELLSRLAPEDRGGARGEKLSGMCLRALQRMRLLVEDHFLAERLGVKGIPLHPEPLAPRELLQALVERLGAPSPEIRSPEDAEPYALVDRMLVERALEALLAAAGRGGEPVRVTIAQDRDEVVVRFAGAAPASDALVTPHKGSASDTTGRGLSLHMAVQAARALGGGLTLEEGGYRLALPLATPDGVP